MPELPEVESTVRRLREHLPGKEIKSLHIGWANMAPSLDTTKANRLITGACILDVRRRGKYILLDVERNADTFYIILHQKMSGRLNVVSSDRDRSPYDHIVIELLGEQELRLTDPRKFGRIYITTDGQDIISQLGPEPLDNEFTPSKLAAVLAKRKGGMKALLLNQHIIAGLGNIYVDEVLWRSGIHPQRSAITLEKKQVVLLHRHIREVLSEAIEAHGTDFGDGVIYGGAYSPAVYGRAGEPCLKCASLIQKETIAGRGTHICTVCQS